MKNKIDYDKTQLHAGSIGNTGRKAWHTNSDGSYWIGYTPHAISPEDLLKLTLSTLTDLLANHPELADKVLK